MTAEPDRPPTRRKPLGEATMRVNNSKSDHSVSYKNLHMPHHTSMKPDGLLQVRNPDVAPPDRYTPRELKKPNANPRLSAISRDEDEKSKRDSQVSTASTNASDGSKLKEYIGPWRLGKTLGRGATARVRFARNKVTHVEAAIKIVAKSTAQMNQATSLLNFNQAAADFTMTDPEARRMPAGLEREIAIMKLIEHPHITKLLDIWENRTEIYLVLEYVDNGELFTHIVKHQRLDERESIRIFRQILSAIGYCQTFKICHRDLKPENIFVNSRGDIKIGDFGMAALQQGPDHRLQTSCGSPHYAAPELVKGKAYQGDKVDIWSMGVILYAMLSGRLPFDSEGRKLPPGHTQMSYLLSLIKRGSFEMAPEFSPESANLIGRILQVNPRDRIDINQMWRHPVIRKYDFLDNFGGGGSSTLFPSPSQLTQTIRRKSDIEQGAFSHLRTLWHQFTEQQLIDALLSEKPNEQKMFYSLFIKFIEVQAENYMPDVQYSASDYHHFKPLKLTKTYSTCHFPQTTGYGNKRQTSRFTVISNAPESERSYDPFKASRPQHVDGFRNDPKITIHHADDRSRKASHASSMRSASGSATLQKPSHPRGYVSRSSLASSTRSKSSASNVRPKGGPRRGVSFAHRGSHNGQKNLSGAVPSPLGIDRVAVGRHSNHTEVTDDGGDSLRPIAQSNQYIRSKKSQPRSKELPSPVGDFGDGVPDDFRQLSTSLAKDCDEAFNRAHQAQKSPAKGSAHLLKRISLNSRPLPEATDRPESVEVELIRARRELEVRQANGDGSPEYLERMLAHIDYLMASSSEKRGDGRTGARPLPSIREGGADDTSGRRTKSVPMNEPQERSGNPSSRIASAPEPRQSHRPHHSEDRRPGHMKHTIRVVQPSSSLSPVKAPAPLTIRKKSAQGGPPLFDSRKITGGTHGRRSSRTDVPQQFQAGPSYDASDLSRIEEGNINDRSFESHNGTVLRKKSSWFKRSSRSGGTSAEGADIMFSQTMNHDETTDHGAEPFLEPPKKKGFSIGRLFKKGSPKDMTVAGVHDAYEENDSSDEKSIVANSSRQRRAREEEEETRSRQIAPQQSWLAKLFHFKPITKFICFSVPKQRARRELVGVLREWKRYGIRDVQVDKERNIVFGKVGVKNFLDMKEVSFAAEFFTLVHQTERNGRKHGKKTFLSIARCTQERGAASSFNKVVETLNTVLKIRGLLVANDESVKMMVKTLSSLPS